ncbi:Hypothetical_protein [Hexamita inflata]|uniref:Hypothetical_protein n=1 Tax=Hexamita inflata TaxID=28002 RepID=A0AA86PMS2_9EUKA|nr:Hypothetical protein HINF_LOCUS25945 [Hexamita inflata]
MINKNTLNNTQFLNVQDFQAWMNLFFYICIDQLLILQYFNLQIDNHILFNVLYVKYLKSSHLCQVLAISILLQIDILSLQVFNFYVLEVFHSQIPNYQFFHRFARELWNYAVRTFQFVHLQGVNETEIFEFVACYFKLVVYYTLFKTLNLFFVFLFSLLNECLTSANWSKLK